MGKSRRTNEVQGPQRKVTCVHFDLQQHLQCNNRWQACLNCAFDVPAISTLLPLEVSLRATRSRGSSTAAGRETKITEGKMRRENDSATTTSLTSSCAAKTRPSGARATARSEPRRRATTTATRTVPTVETSWERRTGTTWVTGRSVSETRWARRWAWGQGEGMKNVGFVYDIGYVPGHKSVV